jgi:hypothetical protein
MEYRIPGGMVPTIHNPFSRATGMIPKKPGKKRSSVNFNGTSMPRRMWDKIDGF